jgi:putative ABC transport system permease protein
MIIATLVLLISCINYIILATAQSIKRAKEIGIRKIIGASKLSIFMHLFFEAWVIALLSMPITIMLTELLLPEISASLNVRISMDYIHDIRFLYGLFILISFVALLSSLYVAVFISKLQTIEILKFKINTKGSRFNLRHGFIFLQLSIFAGLIFSTLVIKSQLKFFRENSFGYDKENVFVIRTYDKELPEKYSTLINELRKIPEIENISAASELPPQLGGMLYKLPNNKNPKELVEINGFSVDYNFIQTLGLELIEGRDFSREYSTDSLSGIILNETAMSRLELEDERTIYGFKIIGVVKDFNFGSLHDPISPMAFQLASKIKYLNEIAILINSKNVSGTVEKIKSTWNKLFSTPPIKYFFLNEKVDKLYRSDEKFSKLINIFTGFAIFITCLGLFGLTMYITQQRTKEIGIRKVFGAKVKNIYLLMSKEFIFLLFGSLIVGFPISLMFLNKWLSNFAYKVSIGFDIYLLTALLALIILMLSTCIQSIRAAVVNPVDSLRDE